VLLGAPIKTDLTDKWKAASSVVANRFVNGYSKKDVVLGSIFRLHALGLDVAGEDLLFTLLLFKIAI